MRQHIFDVLGSHKSTRVQPLSTMNGDANYENAVQHSLNLCFEYELELQKYREEIARLNLEVAELKLDNLRLRNRMDIPATPICSASTPIAGTPKLKKRRRNS